MLYALSHQWWSLRHSALQGFAESGADCGALSIINPPPLSCCEVYVPAPREIIHELVIIKSPTMTIISATTLLRAISLFHITASYYLLTSPSTITDQNFVFILGASMDIPVAPKSLSTRSAALALASLAFGLLGLSDLTATNLHEEIGSHYWSSQAPIRIAFFAVITAYSYLYKPTGGALSEHGAARPALGKAGGIGALLCNSLVFTWGFVEMLIWFWVSHPSS